MTWFISKALSHSVFSSVCDKHIIYKSEGERGMQMVWCNTKHELSGHMETTSLKEARKKPANQPTK